MISELDNFYLKQDEPNRSCFMALKEIILSNDVLMKAEWKYKLPFFYYKNKAFCYLWQDVKTKIPYIGIVRSSNLDHPKLFLGKSKKMKKYYVNPNEDINVNELHEILNVAKRNY